MQDTKNINLRDITVQAYKSSGPGGQHRNKVETAIRVIHNPTGIIVTASDSRSKLQNKKKALNKLQEALNSQKEKAHQNFNVEQWMNKIEIERGSPAKVFYGPKFIEV